MEKYGRCEEAPVPRSRTCLEDATFHNLLPHLYPARLRSPRENAAAENPKRGDSGPAILVVLQVLSVQFGKGDASASAFSELHAFGVHNRTPYAAYYRTYRLVVPVLAPLSYESRLLSVITAAPTHVDGVVNISRT